MRPRRLACTLGMLFALAACRSHETAPAAVVDAAEAPPVLAEFADACAVRFTGRMKNDGPEYEVTNRTNKKPKSCTLMGYAYDADGKQIAISHSGGANPTYGVKLSPAPAPGVTDKQSFGMEFDDDRTKAPGVSFEAIVIAVELADGTFLGDERTYPKERPMTRRK